jgi:flagellar hook-length control protein FliK
LHRFLSSTPEHNLADVKLDAGSATFLRSCVDQLLGHIESQQDQAVARWAEGETQQVFVHTLALKDQDNPVQLKIYYPAKKGHHGNGQQHRIAILLDMDKLGPVRVDLVMQSRMLQITFYVQHSRARGLIESQVQEMASSLAGSFDHISIDVFVSKKKIVQFETEDAQGAGAGRINLNV